MQNKKTGRQSPDYTALIWCVSIGLVCFAAHIFICKVLTADPAVTGLVLLAVYIAAVSFFLIRVIKYHINQNSADSMISANTNALRDLLAQIGTGLVLTDGNGRIIWYNDALGEEFSLGTEGVGTSMYSFFDITEEKLLNETVENGGKIFKYDRKHHYNVTCFKVRANIKSRDDVHSFYLTVFNDTTKLDLAKKKLENESPAMAYIVVDNLEELAQYVKVSYRQATNEIELILKDWAQSIGGVLREYDRDRYIMFFTRSKLEKCIEDKFSILDKIRNIRLSDDDTNMPVTVSMGISSAPVRDENDVLDLTAIERDAASALDMALQRGGDQVACKSENGMEYFGGRTKTMQKRTRVRARVIATKLCTLISESKRVLIMGHKNPDFDSIGACVGIARLAMYCGVECRIIADLSHENFKISTEKLVGLPEYTDVFIDGASAIDLLTPDTLLIITDANNFRIIEAPEIAENAKTIYVIDHHRQTDEMPASVVNPPYIDPAASSSCELVSEILEQCVPTGTLLKEEANVLLSGIMVDTKYFTRTTSTRTFSAALYLRGEGGNSEVARTFFNENYNDYLAEAKFGGDVTTYRSRIAITKSPGTGSPADRIAAAKAADKLLTVRGIDASFALVDTGNSINISARSNGKINVQLILEKLNGGGHFDVAGAQVQNTTMLDATVMLKAAIDEYLDNNKS